MLVSSRDRIECLHAIFACLRNASNGDKNLLRVSPTHWIGHIQDLPALRLLPVDWFRATTDEIRLPLPNPLTEILIRLQHELTDNLLRTAGESDEWSQTWGALRDRIRGICPRFTETRAINTMPVAVYLQTGHLRDAQWMAGSSLAHSTAPGHYYAATATRLHSIYRDALSSMGIPIHERSEHSSLLTGAPRAAINWSFAQCAVYSLVERVRDDVRLHKAPLEQTIAGITALGAYTAAMYAMCTAHRCTAAIGQVTRRSILVFAGETRRGTGDAAYGLTVVADKSSNVHLDARVCALPSTFVAQVDAYLRQLERLERRLSKAKTHDYPELMAAVRNALSGHGPLWFHFEHDAAVNENVAALNRPTLSSFWSEWHIPLPLVRHLFASNATEFAIAGHDIALQMGHAIDGNAFDASDPDSPAEFTARVAQPLDAYLAALGFEAIGAVRRHDPPKPCAALRAADIWALHREVQKARGERNRAALPIPTQEEKDTASGLVETLTTTAGSADIVSDSDEWSIAPDNIQALLENAAKRSIGTQIALREQIATAVEHRPENINRRIGKRIPAVPQLRGRENAYSEICITHLYASHWAHTAESIALEALDQCVDANDKNGLIASAAILLSLYGAGCTTARLLALMDPDTPLHGFERLASGVIAGIPLNRAKGRRCARESQMVSGSVFPIVAGLRRHLSKPPTESQLSKALRKQSQINALFAGQRDPLNLLLAVAGLARQIHAPGTRAAWETGRLASVGPSIERLAPLLGARIDRPVSSPAQLPTAPPPLVAERKPRVAHRNYRRLTRLLHDITQASDTKKRALELEALHAEFERTYGASGLLTLLAGFATHLWRRRKLAASTAYDYLTTIGARLVREFDATDVHELDTDALEQCLREIALNARTGSKRQSSSAVPVAILGFVDLLTDNGLEIDAGQIFDGLNVTVERNPGYLASQEEMNAIRHGLASATEAAIADAHNETTPDETNIAECAALIQMPSGLRLREAAGLMKADLSLDADQVAVTVRPIKRRGLKSRASKRTVVVPVADDHHTRLSETLTRLEDRRSQATDLLLATDGGTRVGALARTMASAFRVSATPVITGRQARSHIARHNLATAAQIAVHSDQVVSHLTESDGFSLATLNTTRRRFLSLQRLPARVRLRYASRQLGHGSVTTTMTWYGHALSLMHCGPTYLRGIDRRLEATLIGRPLRDIDTWRMRHGGVMVNDRATQLWRFDPAWVGTTIHPVAETIDFSKVSLASKDFANIAPPTCRLLALIALHEREGYARMVAANRIRMRFDRHEYLLASLSRYDDAFNLRYLTGRRLRYRNHLRVPRAHHLLPFFKAIDAAITSSAIAPAELRNWVLEQLPKSQTTLVFDQSTYLLYEQLAKRKRVSAVIESREQYTLTLEKADRKLILLVIAGVALEIADSHGPRTDADPIAGSHAVDLKEPNHAGRSSEQ